METSEKVTFLRDGQISFGMDDIYYLLFYVIYDRNTNKFTWLTIRQLTVNIPAIFPLKNWHPKTQSAKNKGTVPDLSILQLPISSQS